MYIYLYMFISTHLHTCEQIFIDQSTYLSIYTYVYVYIYLYKYICVYICIYICIRILCMYIKQRISILCLIYVYLLQGSKPKLVGPFWHVLEKRDPPAWALRFEKVFEKRSQQVV